MHEDEGKLINDALRTLKSIQRQATADMENARDKVPPTLRIAT